MSATPAKIPRPPAMRRLLHNQIKLNLGVAIVTGFVAAFIYKATVMEPRKHAYATFYKNYDADKSFEAMRKKGLFQSCPAD